MAKLKRTAQDVCIAYADAVAEVRRLTRKIGTCDCIRVAAWNKLWADWTEDQNLPCEPQPSTCLYVLWNLPQGPEGEVHPQRIEEAHAEMCGPCSEAYEYIQARKLARRAVGAAKRSVEAMGKRLKVVVN